MQYLVHVTLVSSARPTTAEEGRILAEQFILPTLARCEELVAQKKIRGAAPSKEQSPSFWSSRSGPCPNSTDCSLAYPLGRKWRQQ